MVGDMYKIGLGRISRESSWRVVEIRLVKMEGSLDGEVVVDEVRIK